MKIDPLEPRHTHTHTHTNKPTFVWWRWQVRAAPASDTGHRSNAKSEPRNSKRKREPRDCTPSSIHHAPNHTRYASLHNLGEKVNPKKKNDKRCVPCCEWRLVSSCSCEGGREGVEWTDQCVHVLARVVTDHVKGQDRRPNDPQPKLIVMRRISDA